jgi:hypothetical protein
MTCSFSILIAPIAASTRITQYAGSTSHARAAKFSDCPKRWWLFWNSSPSVTKSKNSVFLLRSSFSKFR